MAEVICNRISDLQKVGHTLAAYAEACVDSSQQAELEERMLDIHHHIEELNQELSSMGRPSVAASSERRVFDDATLPDAPAASSAQSYQRRTLTQQP